MSSRASPLDNKPCRQCTTFKEYMKQSKKQVDAQPPENESESKCAAPDFDESHRADCPLDKDQLGRKTWGFLHTMAAAYPDNPSRDDQNDMKQFFNLLGKFYPCEHCAADLRQDLKKEPPQVSTQHTFSQWLCRLHNKVNIKIGKEEFDCSKVNERWRDGWLDGSCDY